MLSYKFSQTQVIITLDNLWLREEQMNMSKFYEVSKVIVQQLSFKQNEWCFCFLILLMTI